MNEEEVAESLTWMTWGSFVQNGYLVALVCPNCGAFVSPATDQSSGVSAKDTHIAFHRTIAGKVNR